MRTARAVAGALLAIAGTAAAAGAVPPPAPPPTAGEVLARSVAAVLTATTIRVDIEAHMTIALGPSGDHGVDGPIGSVTWGRAARMASGRVHVGRMTAEFRAAGRTAWVRVDPLTGGWWRLPVRALVPRPLADELEEVGAPVAVGRVLARALALPGAAATLGRVVVPCDGRTCWEVSIVLPRSLIEPAPDDAPASSPPSPSRAPGPPVEVRLLVETGSGWPSSIEIDATTEPASPVRLALRLTRPAAGPDVRAPHRHVRPGPLAELPGSLPWPADLVPPSLAPADPS